MAAQVGCIMVSDKFPFKKEENILGTTIYAAKGKKNPDRKEGTKPPMAINVCVLAIDFRFKFYNKMF